MLSRLMIELAKEFPQFGYIKEEAAPIIARTRELAAAYLRFAASSGPAVRTAGSQRNRISAPRA